MAFYCGSTRRLIQGVTQRLLEVKILMKELEGPEY